MSSSASQYKTGLLVFAVVVILWAIMGAMDINKATQVGYNTDGNNTITQVYDGGPAKAAGLQVGDFLVSIDGISTADAAAFSKLPRPALGQVRTFLVDRGGQEVSMDITSGPLLQRTKNIGYAATLISLCYIGFTLMAYLASQNRATLVLAFMGCALGLAFAGGPYIESAGARSIVITVQSIIVVTGVGALLHFLLVFPNPREFINKDNATKILYSPALAWSLMVAYRQLLTPEATSALNNFTNILAGLVFGGYLVGSIVVMLQNHSRASAEVRDARGLNTMMIGTLVGMLPVTITTVIGIFSPQTVLPGQDYYFLTLILIPVTWSMAAKK